MCLRFNALCFARESQCGTAEWLEASTFLKRHWLLRLYGVSQPSVKGSGMLLLLSMHWQAQLLRVQEHVVKELYRMYCYSCKGWQIPKKRILHQTNTDSSYWKANAASS